MDLYLLDEDYNAVDVIDGFESLIWTERYNANGDVELVVPANQKNKNALTEGIFLGLSGSKEAMYIDTVLDEGGKLKLTGESLVTLFKTRILRDSWSTAKTSWQLTDTAGNICNTMVGQMLTSAGVIYNGILPSTYGHYEVLTISSQAAPVTPSITVAVPYGNLYDAVKSVCDLASLGFALYPVAGTPGSLSFETYLGRDMTSSQSTNPPVIFDPALDSLENVKEIRSLAGYATAAYVFANGITSQAQVGAAFASGTDTFTAFKRRSLMINASDVNAADYSAAQLTSIVNQRAIDALANNNYVRMSDGQLVPQKSYNYGTDYKLGDIIELRGSSSTAQHARITEHIRAQDSSGERSYPTLSVIS